MKFCILALAFVLAVVAVVASSPVVAQDVIYSSRPAAVPVKLDGTEKEQKFWDAIMQLNERIRDLERKLDKCKCGERSIVKSSRRSRVWAVVQTPSDGSCRYCEPFKQSLKDTLIPLGWVVGSPTSGDVLFETVENDGKVFPRTLFFVDGNEVARAGGVVSASVVADTLNFQIKSLK